MSWSIFADARWFQESLAKMAMMLKSLSAKSHSAPSVDWLIAQIDKAMPGIVRTEVAVSKRPRARSPIQQISFHINWPELVRKGKEMGVPEADLARQLSAFRQWSQPLLDEMTRSEPVRKTKLEKEEETGEGRVELPLESERPEILPAPAHPTKPTPTAEEARALQRRMPMPTEKGVQEVEHLQRKDERRKVLDRLFERYRQKGQPPATPESRDEAETQRLIKDLENAFDVTPEEAAAVVADPSQAPEKLRVDPEELTEVAAPAEGGGSVKMPKKGEPSEAEPMAEEVGMEPWEQSLIENVEACLIEPQRQDVTGLKMDEIAKIVERMVGQLKK
jgi:hypothetical protein